MTIGHTGDISEAVAAAVEEYQAWQDYSFTGEWNAERLTALLYQAGAESLTYTDTYVTIGGTTTHGAVRVPLDADSPTYFVGTVNVTMA